MGRYIFWSLVLLITLPVSYVYAVPVTLFIWTLVGIDPSVMFEQLNVYRYQLLFAVAVTALVLMVFVLIHLILRRDVYKRNHAAHRLIQKYVRRELTDLDERRQFQAFMNDGTIAYNSRGQLRVSDRAVEDMM